MSQLRVYLRHDYEMHFRQTTLPESDFVGPFPSQDFARKHQELYGPIAAKIVTLDYEPDAAHTMTPGQAVDHVLARG